MNRNSVQPHLYASLDDLQQALLVQMRRFRRACSEIAATVTILSPSRETPRSRPGSDKNLDQLELLHDQVTLLKNMALQLLVNFPGDRRAESVRKQVESLTSGIEQRANDLRGKMSEAAQGGGVDRKVVLRNAALAKKFKEDYGASVQDVFPSYLTGTISLPQSGGDCEADLAYLRLDELRGDDGYAHPHYYVVTAHPRATRDANGRPVPDMLISVSPEFKVPRKIRWRAKASENKDLRPPGTHLRAGDGVISRQSSRAIPVPRDAIRLVHDNIARTSVRGNVVTVFVKNVDDLEGTLYAAREQLRAIVRKYDPKNRDQPLSKINRDRGSFDLILGAPARMKGRTYPNEVLTRIQRMLHVTPQDLQRIKTALEDPE